MPGGTPSRCSRAPGRAIRRRWLRERVVNCVSSHHGSVIVVFACLLNLINREMFTGRQQLLFGEHKHPSPPLSNSSQVNGTSGYCSIDVPCCCRLHKSARHHQRGNRRVTENATRQFQAVGARCQASSGSWRYSFGRSDISSAST